MYIMVDPDQIQYSVASYLDLHGLLRSGKCPGCRIVSISDFGSQGSRFQSYCTWIQLISDFAGGGIELISDFAGGGIELISDFAGGGIELISDFAGGGIELMTVWCFITQSLSLSPVHHLTMT